MAFSVEWFLLAMVVLWPIHPHFILKFLIMLIGLKNTLKTNFKKLKSNKRAMKKTLTFILRTFMHLSLGFNFE